MTKKQNDTDKMTEGQLDTVTGGVWMGEDGRGCFPIPPLGKAYLPVSAPVLAA